MLYESTEHAEPAAAPVREIYLSDVVKAIFTRRKFIFMVTGTTAVLAAMVTLLLPNRFTATTVILPPGNNNSSGAGFLGQLGSLGGGMGALVGGGLNVKILGEMYVSLLRSRTVEDALIQRYSLSARYKSKKMWDARKELERRSTATYGTKDGLITVTVTDKDPKFAAELANGYIDEFRKFSAHLAISEAGQRRLFFQEQLRSAKNDLSTAEEALKGTQQATGILEVNSQIKSVIDSAAVLREELATKQVQLQSLRSYATDMNPQIIRVQKEIAALQGQLNQIAGTAPSLGMITPKKAVSNAQLEYLRKAHDVKYYQTIVDLLSQQYETAKIDEAKEGALVQVIDYATIPDKKSSPNRTFIVLGMTVFSAMLVCLWIVYVDIRKRLAKRVDLPFIRSQSEPPPTDERTLS